MSNIHCNNFRKIDCKLINDEYVDFMISKDDVINNNFYDYIISDLNFINTNNKHIVSNISWKNSVTSNSILKNIGYTGVDNGFINYQKDKISNEEFLELYTNSNFDLSTFDDKFFVTEVTGNTNQFSYPIEKYKDYIALKGGFYQGFFKIYGDKYQTLPHIINNEWDFSITLRKQNYETKNNILNKRYPENKGLFLYIGTRAENKFWELYKKSEISNEYKYNDSDDYSIDYDYTQSDVIKHKYYEDNIIEECDNAIDEDYLMEDISLENIDLKDSKGYNIKDDNIYEIETDNKFIIFNRTKNGFNIDTWDDNNKFILTGQTVNTPNLFLYLNKTNTGHTIDDINEVLEEFKKEYNIFKDINNNALGFKINDDGSIGYRYLINNGDIIEEKSKPNIIKNNEWTTINVKIVNKNPTDCNHNENDKMQIYIYVNGYLKLISKELPILNLHELNDSPQKQEGVPYSISIGGGSQGLSERIFLNYYDISDYQMPIEKYFAGTFIGDIKNFKIYSF